MTIQISLNERMIRDGQKWQRWSASHRLIKRVMDPQRARQMRDASDQLAYFQHTMASVQGAPQSRGPQPMRLSWWMGRESL